MRLIKNILKYLFFDFLAKSGRRLVVELRDRQVLQRRELRGRTIRRGHPQLPGDKFETNLKLKSSL